MRYADTGMVLVDLDEVVSLAGGASYERWRGKLIRAAVYSCLRAESDDAGARVLSACGWPDPAGAARLLRASAEVIALRSLPRPSATLDCLPIGETRLRP